MGMIDDMAELLNKFDVPFVQDGSRLYYPNGKIARATIRYHWDKDIFSVGGMINFYGKMGDIVIALENDWSIISLKEQVTQLEKEVEQLRLGQAGLSKIVRGMWRFISSEMDPEEVREIQEYIQEIHLATEMLEQRKELNHEHKISRTTGQGEAVVCTEKRTGCHRTDAGLDQCKRGNQADSQHLVSGIGQHC